MSMKIGEDRNVLLIGRGVEASEFRELFNEPVAASLSCVYGPPGIGKTTLLLRFQEEATKLGVPCLFLRGKNCKDYLTTTEGDMHFIDAPRLWQALEVTSKPRSSLIHFRSRRAHLPEERRG